MAHVLYAIDRVSDFLLFDRSTDTDLVIFKEKKEHH